MGKLAIVGLGLIGGSLGLALKRAEPENTEVVGYDRNVEVAARAFKFGAVQSIAPTLRDAVSSATMVIIATPTMAVRSVLQDIGPLVKKGTVITDTASTKSEVLRWARDILPAGVNFVGGHPMAGKEQSGPQAAEETLFDGRPYCIVPAVDATPGAVNAVVDLATAVGGQPLFLDASEHDSYAAAISHVPLVASVALFGLARGSQAWPELAGLSGPAFRDLTRLASGQPEMAHDIFLTNRQNVVHWLERYIVELRKLADLIENDDEGETLFRTLAEAQLERDEFIDHPPERPVPGKGDVDLPSPSESLMDMMAGTMWRERVQQMTGALQERQAERERERRLHRQDENQSPPKR